MSTAQEHIDSGLYPKDIEDAVQRWDHGDQVWTVEMGGIGPGYEQCIQVGMIELLRRLIGIELPKKSEDWNEFLDAHLDDVLKEFDLGLSGSQAGAIKQLACKFASQGWASTEKVQDRMILISKNWPGVKKDEPV